MPSHFESARRCKLLARLTDDELSAFMRFADFKGVSPVFEICKTGEWGDSLFILLTGEGFAIFAFGDSIAMYALGMTVLTFGEMFSMPIGMAYAAELSPENAIYSASTSLVSWPIFSMSMVTTSPGLSQRCGLAAMPTPCGVPVRMIVPGSRVVLPLRNSIKVGTSKIMSFVFQS